MPVVTRSDHAHSTHAWISRPVTSTFFSPLPRLKPTFVRYWSYRIEAVSLPVVIPLQCKHRSVAWTTTRTARGRLRGTELCAMPRFYRDRLAAPDERPSFVPLTLPLSYTQRICADQASILHSYLIDSSGAMTPPRKNHSLDKPCSSTGEGGDYALQTRVSGHLNATLRIVLKAHMPQNHTPSLRSGITLPEILVIIPHQLTIGFRHKLLLRARVHGRSAVEMEPWARHRCGKVRFVRNEELGQERAIQWSSVETRIREVTDCVWVRDRPFELDRQGLQDERYTLSLDHGLSLLGSSHFIS